jgi:hypothetical protein
MAEHRAAEMKYRTISENDEASVNRNRNRYRDAEAM